jgi:hypothetical protein
VIRNTLKEQPLCQDQLAPAKRSDFPALGENAAVSNASLKRRSDVLKDHTKKEPPPILDAALKV